MPGIIERLQELVQKFLGLGHQATAPVPPPPAVHLSGVPLVPPTVAMPSGPDLSTDLERLRRFVGEVRSVPPTIDSEEFWDDWLDDEETSRSRSSATESERKTRLTRSAQATDKNHPALAGYVPPADADTRHSVFSPLLGEKPAGVLGAMSDAGMATATPAVAPPVPASARSRPPVVPVGATPPRPPVPASARSRPPVVPVGATPPRPPVPHSVGAHAPGTGRPARPLAPPVPTVRRAAPAVPEPAPVSSPPPAPAPVKPTEPVWIAETGHDAWKKARAENPGRVVVMGRGGYGFVYGDDAERLGAATGWRVTYGPGGLPMLSMPEGKLRAALSGAPVPPPAAVPTASLLDEPEKDDPSAKTSSVPAAPIRHRLPKGSPLVPAASPAIGKPRRAEPPAPPKTADAGTATGKPARHSPPPATGKPSRAEPLAPKDYAALLASRTAHLPAPRTSPGFPYRPPAVLGPTGKPARTTAPPASVPTRGTRTLPVLTPLPEPEPLVEEPEPTAGRKRRLLERMTAGGDDHAAYRRGAGTDFTTSAEEIHRRRMEGAPFTPKPLDETTARLRRERIEGPPTPTRPPKPLSDRTLALRRERLNDEYESADKWHRRMAGVAHVADTVHRGIKRFVLGSEDASWLGGGERQMRRRRIMSPGARAGVGGETFYDPVYNPADMDFDPTRPRASRTPAGVPGRTTGTMTMSGRPAGMAAGGADNTAVLKALQEILRELKDIKKGMGSKTTTTGSAGKLPGYTGMGRRDRT